MNFIKKHGLKFLFIAIPLVLAAIFWNQVPESLPVHWNLQGEPDRFGSRHEAFLIAPVAIAFFYGLLAIIPLIDPKKNIDTFKSTLDKVGHIFALFMLFIFSVTLAIHLGYELNIGKWIMLGITFLFIVLGNFFGKFRPNYFVGIRTPWTLENKDNWNRTHRFAGILWVSASLIMALILIFSGAGEFVASLFFVYVAVIAILPILYSYWLYRKGERLTE